MSSKENLGQQAERGVVARGGLQIGAGRTDQPGDLFVGVAAPPFDHRFRVGVDGVVPGRGGLFGEQAVDDGVRAVDLSGVYQFLAQVAAVGVGVPGQGFEHAPRVVGEFLPGLLRGTHVARVFVGFAQESAEGEVVAAHQVAVEPGRVDFPVEDLRGFEVVARGGVEVGQPEQGFIGAVARVGQPGQLQIPVQVVERGVELVGFVGLDQHGVYVVPLFGRDGGAMQNLFQVVDPLFVHRPVVVALLDLLVEPLQHARQLARCLGPQFRSGERQQDDCCRYYSIGDAPHIRSVLIVGLFFKDSLFCPNIQKNGRYPYFSVFLVFPKVAIFAHGNKEIAR